MSTAQLAKVVRRLRERSPARRVEISADRVEFARSAGIDPDPWQADVLRSESGRILLNCSRQSGKSTIVAVLAVHTALFNPNALVLLLSPTIRQSGVLFEKCQTIYQGSGRVVEADSETQLTLTLANGSRIVSLPGRDDAQIRGYSEVTLLLIDEAARVNGALYHAALPMLAVSQGRLVALSTPHGSQGWFYEAWRGEEAWERYQVPASMCPRISEDFLQEQWRSMGEWWYRQEFDCVFLDAETQLFGREEVERALREDVEQWNVLSGLSA